MTHDPIGPGTPAWEAFDQALLAYAAALARGPLNSRINRDYKRYNNHRQYMLECLRKHGATPDTISQWCANLKSRIQTQDFGEE